MVRCEAAARADGKLWMLRLKAMDEGCQPRTELWQLLLEQKPDSRFALLLAQSSHLVKTTLQLCK